MSEERHDSINLMNRALTVRELKNILDGLDDNLAVVLASDYGNQTHTTQLMEIEAVHIIDAKNIEDSRYSESGSCFVREEYIEEEYDDHLTVQGQVCVLRTPSVNCEDHWEMPQIYSSVWKPLPLTTRTQNNE